MGLDSGVKEWPLKSGLLYVRPGLFEPSVWTTKKAQIKVLCFIRVGLVRLGPGSDSAGLSSAWGFRKTGLVPPLLE